MEPSSGPNVIPRRALPGLAGLRPHVRRVFAGWWGLAWRGVLPLRARACIPSGETGRRPRGKTELERGETGGDRAETPRGRCGYLGAKGA